MAASLEFKGLTATDEIAIHIGNGSGRLARTMALLVFFAATAVTQVIASWRRNGAYRFNPLAHGLPQLAQVIHRPYCFAKRVEPRNAGAGHAVFAQG